MNDFLLDVERGIRQGLLELLEESENDENRRRVAARCGSHDSGQSLNSAVINPTLPIVESEMVYA
ncbi:MAG: hypothetical protein KDD43_09775 [Bdellovibrionales bacterium]|nr:hypothetical protein [Bdellovibrionales bacterium]